MKKLLGCRGQIGPNSLEDIFPLAIAIIILFIFIAFTFNSVGANLSTRNIEGMHEAAIGTGHILLSKSVFVYAQKEGLFDSQKLDDYAFFYNEIAEKYGVTGYNFSAKVSDLEDAGREWVYAPDKIGRNTASIGFPVAIRYDVDVVHAGLLEVKVWREGK